MKRIATVLTLALATSALLSCCASKSVEAPPKPTYQAPKF